MVILEREWDVVMINRDSLVAVEKGYFGKGFCRPIYDGYGFSKIPATIEALLTGRYGRGLPRAATNGEQVDDLFFFLIDGFGWKFFEKFADQLPFLRRLKDEGIASKITSQFPSTTAAHVTCLNTGLPVSETGVYEWFYYEPKLDRVIAPLMFSFAGDKEPGTLEKTGISPTELYPTKTLYQQLNRQDIDSYVFRHHTIIDSPYSTVMYDGSTPIGYEELGDGLSKLITLAKKPRSRPSYFYFYFGDIDGMGHRYGTHSEHFVQAIEHCFQGLEDLFWNRLGKLKRKGAVLLTADHGMSDVNPSETFYLNQELPDLISYFSKNREGKVIAPAGSCRDFFLHVQKEHFKTVQEKLTGALKEVAWVVPTGELIQKGFFGSGHPSPEFLGRVGNLVILPYEGHSVWWLEKGRFDQHFLGAHGGLSKSEMETIFLFKMLDTGARD